MKYAEPVYRAILLCIVLDDLDFSITAPLSFTQDPVKTSTGGQSTNSTTAK